MATKRAKKVNTKFDLNKGVNSIKHTTKNINEFALETSNEVIGATLSTANLWQDVAQKAIKGGFKLVRKQQDITFDTLETVKVELVNSRKRLARLFNNN